MEIKPCPFCGDGDPQWDEKEIDGEMYHFLVCSACECEGPIGESHDDAADRWNRRT